MISESTKNRLKPQHCTICSRQVDEYSQTAWIS